MSEGILMMFTGTAEAEVVSGNDEETTP